MTLGTPTAENPRVKKDQQNITGYTGGDYFLLDFSTAPSLFSISFYLTYIVK